MNELQARKPNRLHGYDYSTNGAYFVTICSKDRARIFGTITVGDGLAHPGGLAHPAHPANAIIVQLSEYGRIAEAELQNIPTHYNGRVTVDCFVVMPNHIHAIIIITGGMSGDETGRGITTTGRASPSPTLGNIVGGYKSGVSRRCGFPVWQRSYYDHIIRDETDYRRIAAYIENNPARWQEDRFCGG
jgi:REP element-mobilizing transposase RayT